MRIFRTIMVLTGATVLMPSPPEVAGPRALAEAGEQVSVVTAASRAVSDVASFCYRQPGVCDTAGFVAAKLEAKAKYGVRLIYEWASEANGEPIGLPHSDQAAADPITTGSTKFTGTGGAIVSQSTLRIEDLIPEWRGPVPDKG